MAIRRRVVEMSDLSAVAKDLGFDAAGLLDEPLAFIDRHGTYVAPWQVAEHRHPRCEALCRSRAQSRREGGSGGSRPGRTTGPSRPIEEGAVFIPPEKCTDWLREKEPVFAQVRESCGAAAVEEFN